MHIVPKIIQDCICIRHKTVAAPVLTMNQSSVLVLLLVIPLVLVPLVTWCGWYLIPVPQVGEVKRERLLVVYLMLTLGSFLVIYCAMMEGAPLAFQVLAGVLMVSFLCVNIYLLVDSLPRGTVATNNSTQGRYYIGHTLLIAGLIVLITITCACFQSSINQQQSMSRGYNDFEYYGTARITGQRFPYQQDDDAAANDDAAAAQNDDDANQQNDDDANQQDDDAAAQDDDGANQQNDDDEAANQQADDDYGNPDGTDLWTSVEWMCPSKTTTLCQQELSSSCTDNTNYDDDSWRQTYFGQVRVYNANNVEEECDTDFLMDLVNNNNNADDGYDAASSPQKDGSPYLYIVANCTEGCSANFASSRLQEHYNDSRTMLRAGYVCLGLSVVGLVALIGMTLYKWRARRSTNKDAGVELLPSGQGQVA